MLDYDSIDTSKYVYLPKMGEERVFKIKTVKSVNTGQERFHFQQKKDIEVDGKVVKIDENLGWHIECELEDGKVLSVTSISAFLQVFKKHKINDGDEVLIRHIDKGEWEVEKLNAPKEETLQESTLPNAGELEEELPY